MKTRSSTSLSKNKEKTWMGSLSSILKMDQLSVPEPKIKNAISAPSVVENGDKTMVMLFFIGGVTPTEIR